MLALSRDKRIMKEQLDNPVLSTEANVTLSESQNLERGWR